MNLDLKGKNALVCGSTQGIGLASAQELALLGANVTLFARNKTSLEEAVVSLHRDGNQTHGYMLADKQTVREWYNVKRISKKVRDNVLQYMKDTLANYAAWINGECWFIGIYSDGELQDCTTIYGDPSDELDSLCKQYGIDRDDIVDERWD